MLLRHQLNIILSTYTRLVLSLNQLMQNITTNTIKWGEKTSHVSSSNTRIYQFLSVMLSRKYWECEKFVTMNQVPISSLGPHSLNSVTIRFFSSIEALPKTHILLSGLFHHTHLNFFCTIWKCFDWICTMWHYN